MLQLDEQGLVTYLNAAAQAEFDLGAPDSGKPHWRNLLTSNTSGHRFRPMLAGLQRRDRWEGEVLLATRRAPQAPFHLLAVAHRDAEGRVRRYSALLRNVAAERQAQQRVQRQADILKAVSEAIPATVVVVDAEGRYRFANRAFERYVGLNRDQILGRRAIDVLGAEEVARRKPYMAQAYSGNAVEFTLDYPSDKGTRWFALSCVPLKVDGVVDGFVGIGQDVTQQHLEHARLSHLAETDPLTGLLNRAGFERGVEMLMHADAPAPLALLYIDLDHFKPVNDRYGHPVGDRLLQLFAERLKHSVRTTDIVARLGGDEFAVLLPGVTDKAQALIVADKVLAAAGQAFAIDGRSLAVSASIGIAIGLQPQLGWRELVARADANLYRAKAAGRGRYDV